MAVRIPRMLLPSARRCLPWGKEKILTTGAIGGARRAESIRNRSDAGSGAGKGGGSGGSIRSAGGSVGKRSVVQEEEYFKREQAKEIKSLRKMLMAMQKGKMEYHEHQRDRHVSQIKKHEEQMAKDKDPKHKIHIESHKESIEAHTQYLKKLEQTGAGKH